MPLPEGVHLSSGQPDQTFYHSWPLDASTGGTSELRSTGPNLVPILGHYMPLPGGTSDQMSS